jgi:hypothetical protein
MGLEDEIVIGHLSLVIGPWDMLAAKGSCVILSRL